MPWRSKPDDVADYLEGADASSVIRHEIPQGTVEAKPHTMVPPVLALTCVTFLYFSGLLARGFLTATYFIEQALEAGCQGRDDDSAECQHARSIAALQSTATTLGMAFPQLVVVAFFSGLSDRWGRRPVLLLGQIGGLIDAVVLWASAKWSLPFGCVVAGHVFEGLCGGLTLFLAVSVASATDHAAQQAASERCSVEDATRRRGCAVISLKLGIAVAVVMTPGLAGAGAQRYGFARAFALATAPAILGMAITFAACSEAKKTATPPPTAALLRSAETVNPLAPLYRAEFGGSPRLAMFGASFALISLSVVGGGDLTINTLSVVVGWSPARTGLFISGLGCSCIVWLLLLPPAARALAGKKPVRDVSIVRLGWGAIAAGIFALSAASWAAGAPGGGVLVATASWADAALSGSEFVAIAHLRSLAVANAAPGCSGAMLGAVGFIEVQYLGAAACGLVRQSESERARTPARAHARTRARARERAEGESTCVCVWGGRCNQ